MVVILGSVFLLYDLVKENHDFCKDDYVNDPKF